MVRHASLIVCGIAAGLAWFAAPVSAQDYPSRAVKIVVPFPPGGTADAMPRLIGDFLSRKWGQPVVIENPTGAAGNIGADMAYRADPDGYTLLSAPPPPLVINQNLYPNLPFDAAKFEPIIVMAQVPNSIIVNPAKVSATTVPEFISHLRANPGKVTSATQGNGTTSHLTAELFQVMAKVKMRFIPYRGSAPALQGLLAGDVDLMFDNVGNSLQHIRAGRLRALAIANEQRLAEFPDLPIMAETYPGFVATSWFALLAPPKTSPAIVDRLWQAAAEALRMPDVEARLRSLGAAPGGSTPAATVAFLRQETERWSKVITQANIKPE